MGKREEAAMSMWNSSTVEKRRIWVDAIYILGKDTDELELPEVGHLNGPYENLPEELQRLLAENLGPAAISAAEKVIESGEADPLLYGVIYQEYWSKFYPEIVE
jgi:hypothetical protein